MKKIFFPTALLALFTAAFGASAQTAVEGIAQPWQLNFQAPATPVMDKLYDMHNILLYIITVISVFVLVGLLYIAIRFRRKANPVPSKVTHNTKIEIIWTVIPVLILILIAIPSLRLHYYMQRIVEPEMTVKVVGYQWYWHYDYPDHGGFGFDSYMKKDEDLKPGEPRLLAVDNHMVVPVDTKVRIQMTGADVIHAWAVPAFGVKKDAIPGRLNETWFEAKKTGLYYGQCSELCGVGHGFMPITVEVVTKDQFKAWVQKQQQVAGIKPAAMTPEVPASNGKPQVAAPDAAQPTQQTAPAQEVKQPDPNAASPQAQPENGALR